jgi:hypothetical protein
MMIMMTLARKTKTRRKRMDEIDDLEGRMVVVVVVVGKAVKNEFVSYLCISSSG